MVQRLTIFAMAGISALLGVILFVYGFWLRIIQTSRPFAERWSVILLVLAAAFGLAGFIRRR